MSILFPEEADDKVDQLLPADDEPLTEEEELDALENAIDTIPDEDDLVITEAAPEPIGRSWAFDFQRRTFLTGPSGHSPVNTYGEGTLRGWIEKCMNTDQGAHPIHPDEYGIENLGEGIGGPTSQFPTGDYEHRIREALMFHPRIVGVSDFKWDVDPADEAVAVWATVEVDDETTVEIEGVRIVG